MAVPLRRPNPKLADIRCTKLRFSPGDRVLVRTYVSLDKDQQRKMRKSIIKWAGCEVEVLIYNAMAMEIEVERPDRTL